MAETKWCCRAATQPFCTGIDRRLSSVPAAKSSLRYFVPSQIAGPWNCDFSEL